MSAEFSRSLKQVLIHEGGKVNNPNDPGGATNQGVIQRTYDAYRDKKHVKRRSVFLMQDNERDEIYRSQYWDVIKGDDLPPGVSYFTMDGAVNSGPTQSVKWLQRALGSAYKGRVDGVIGMQTIEALRLTLDHDALILRMANIRMEFLRALKTWKHFKNGWTKRVEDARVTGQAWARGSVGPAVVWREGGNAKAHIEDAKKTPSVGIVDGITGSGIVTGAGSTAIAEAKQTLLPLAGSGGWIDNTLAALTVVGVVLTVGGLLYRSWAKKKGRALNQALDLATG